MSGPLPYGDLDQFVNPASFDATKAAALAARLEVIHGSESERLLRATYLDLLEIRAGTRVLEVGCGNGWVLREIARRVGPGGQAVGLDASTELLAIAKSQADQEEIIVDLRHGDARNLPFGEGDFDVALAPLLLLHVPDGDEIIPELIRVVRPGGRVGVLERDNESYIVSHPDRDLTRRIIQTGTDRTAVNAWVGRRLPGLLTRGGLMDVAVQALTIFERQSTGAAVQYILRFADVAAEVGSISPDERQRWLDDLHEEEAQSGFLVGVTYLFAWGTRPRNA
jgi:ubiquinone/menaquinone biosynthesis C-methylase UbiE